MYLCVLYEVTLTFNFCYWFITPITIEYILHYDITCDMVVVVLLMYSIKMVSLVR